MKISIITPSLNQAQYIEETILSVKNQEYSNFEHIIIDGGSTDGTIEIIEKYRDNVRYISEKDSGQTNAINKGLHLADGDILAFINSDDFYFPDAFHKVAEALCKSDAPWLVGDYMIVDQKGSYIQSFVVKYKKFLREIALNRTILLANSIPQPSTFWKREALEQIGFFNEIYKYSFDYEYWLRLMELKKPLILKDKLSAFRIHPESKGTQNYIYQMDEEIKILEARNTRNMIRKLHQLNNSLIKLVYKMIK